MTPARIAVLIAFALVLGLPFLVRPQGREERRAPADAVGTLVIVTPHVEQIRAEFEAAFDRWHARHYGGERVLIDWRVPGGTSEIIKQLEAQVVAAVRAGLYTLQDPADLILPDRDELRLPEVRLARGAVGYDLLFGGGSYEHSGLKRGILLDVPGDDGPVRARARLSAPVGVDPDRLREWYGDNSIGSQRLYDPDRFWLGTALSGFGIVYNRPVIRELGLPEPRSFADLTDPRYAGMLALADPRQSGSVTTTYESILNKEGWDRGWAILREMAANARYFASSSTKPPIDVSQGDAAAGLAIDFYGRGQAQFVMRPGETAETSRVGYVDPEGEVYIDADPISLLQGAPSPELAVRFIEFCLSEEAQALWQLPARTGPRGRDNPAGPSGEPLGPERYELRRMPVRRAMYDSHLQHFVDRVDPFKLASPSTPRGWRDAIAPLMAAFAMDSADDLRAAWAALNRARRAEGFPADRLREMEALFYAMPPHEIVGPDGTRTVLELSEENYAAIAADTGKWRDRVKGVRARIAYTRFFTDNYRRIVELGRAHSARSSSAAPPPAPPVRAAVPVPTGGRTAPFRR